MEIAEIIGAAVVVLAALLGIAKAITKLTPSKKDDAIVESIAGVVEPIIDALDGDSEKE
jgi:hypothetical protein